MELPVSFVETNHSFSVDFGENVDIGIGGYDEGYNHGYADGELEGFNSGYNEGYDTGYNEGIGVFEFVTEVNQLFYRAEFPQGYELELEMPHASKNLSSMFRMATGIKKLTLDVPTEQVYNASYFFYISTVEASTIEEITIPNGMKFNAFDNFARYCGKLTKIDGSIDLSEGTSTSNCFTRCYELKDVEFVPNTIKMSISFADCKNLSNASISSIIEGLATVSTEQELALHATVKDKLTAEQIVTITKTKGWSLA
jgi:hypothetical protein